MKNAIKVPCHDTLYITWNPALALKHAKGQWVKTIAANLFMYGSVILAYLLVFKGE